MAKAERTEHAADPMLRARVVLAQTCQPAAQAARRPRHGAPPEVGGAAPQRGGQAQDGDRAAHAPTQVQRLRNPLQRARSMAPQRDEEDQRLHGPQGRREEASTSAVAPQGDQDPPTDRSPKDHCHLPEQGTAHPEVFEGNE